MASGHVKLDSGVTIRAVHTPDEMIIRIDRPSGRGLPIYETFVLTTEEIEGLKTVLAFADYDDADCEDEANASIRKL